MNISEFQFSTRQINVQGFEVILTAPDGTKFGIFYRAAQQIPDAAVFDFFQQHPKAFFIETEIVETTVVTQANEHLPKKKRHRRKN